MADMHIADVLAHLVNNTSWLEGDREAALATVDALRENKDENRAETVPVSEQRAAGVSPENTVTVADQKSGTPVPDYPQA